MIFSASTMDLSSLDVCVLVTARNAGMSAPFVLAKADGGCEGCVDRVAAAYRSDDLDVVMGLFDPDISIHWNGERVALGADEARRFHAERLGVGTGDRRDLHVRKRLRAASGDTVAVEHESDHRDADGALVAAASAEFWTLRRGLIVEWNVYQSRLDG